MWKKPAKRLYATFFITSRLQKHFQLCSNSPDVCSKIFGKYTPLKLSEFWKLQAWLEIRRKICNIFVYHRILFKLVFKDLSANLFHMFLAKSTAHGWEMRVKGLTIESLFFRIQDSHHKTNMHVNRWFQLLVLYSKDFKLTNVCNVCSANLPLFRPPFPQRREVFSKKWKMNLNRDIWK